MSMVGAFAYAPRAAHAQIIFNTCTGSYNDVSFIHFIREMLVEPGGAKVTLIWNGPADQGAGLGLERIVDAGT